MSYDYPFADADEELKKSVWERGKTIPDFDSDIWRRDVCSKNIKYSDHGDTDSKHGWEIDHIVPSALGGSDDLSNLQPLYWKTNRYKGDTYPWSC